MKNTKTKKLLALILALVMLVGSALPVFAEEAKDDAGTNVSLQEIAGEYVLISYESYKSKYNYSTDLRTGEEVTVAATDYITDEEYTTADIEKDTLDGVDCIVTGETGSVSWKVDVPKAGLYCVRFVYRSVTDKTTDIERVFKLNGKAPYQEARYQSLHKTWSFEYLSENGEREGAFDLDITENELRPTTKLNYVWTEHSIKDNDGYYTIPLEFYMEKGENIITLEAVRDSVAISEVGIYTYEELPKYEDVRAEYEKKGYKPAKADTITFEAELPDLVSQYTIYPVYDRSSPLTSPQDAARIMRNTIGADKWIANGQWIRYSFKCEESGLYQIGIRFMQDTLKGMYTSRSLKINGEYPFEEAKNCQFPYKNEFQYDYLNDGDTYFEFYFEKGKTYEIELEVALGSFADIIRQVDGVITSLNEDYMRILELTGATADEYRDYGFTRVMPEVIQDLGLQATVLYQLVDYIEDIGGIKSETTSTLEQAAVLVERMASDETEIAANLSSLKSWVSSLGTWLSDMSSQFLEMDYIEIVPAGTEPKAAEGGFWKSAWFEIKKFAASFVTDYDSFAVEGDKDEVLLQVWTSSGRDQAQIIKNLIDNGFTAETGTKVQLSLTAGGALLPSILADVGPDVSIDATNPIDMAIRGAILPLNGYDTFDEVISRFAESATVPLSLYGTTYAIPVGQSCATLFCRDDILSELGLEVPETWDELMAMVPVLQFNNMEIGMTQDYNVFLYQQGGNYWKNEGMATNLDDYKSLDAFEYMCNLFTQYSLPISYDAQNRFKTGEMPILISDYMLYNSLTIFAPEIAGLWSFYQIPGTLNEETGEIDHTVMSNISGIIMPMGCKNMEEGWDFIDWYSDKEFQVDFSNEMMALLGPSAKQAVANIEALAELPWSEKEYKTIQTCLNDTAAVEQYPGSYYIGRYTGFAFAAAYNEGADPSDSLLEYIDSINKELSRKRKEFELMLNEDWLAISEFTGFETFGEWREYWAEERDTTPDCVECIQDVDGADYTYVDWMEENGISAENFKDWQNEVKYGETELSYTEWLKK